jgi:diguanylate cyclase (GGDEF)-like protein/PAS domain S-box-containing protein
MKATISAKRKGDALITVRQDNSQKKIEIARMNMAAEKLTGYPGVELIGKNLETILTDKIKEAISDYVDFSDNMADFASVARRVPNFKIINRFGKEVPISLKVFYLTSMDMNKPEYELLMRDITLIQVMEDLKAKLLQDQAQEAIDNYTGLPSETAVVNALQTAYAFLAKNPIEVSFAIVAVDGLSNYIETYGEPVALDLVKSVAGEVKKTCRDEDIIAHLGDGDIGVVLLDCNTDNAKAVLNRVKKNITSKMMALTNGREIQVTVSIVYIQLKATYELASLYEATRSSIVEVQERGGNAIHEV